MIRRRAVVRADYTREIRVAASCDRTFEAIATVDGLRRWWTPLVTGSDQRGGKLRLVFKGVNEHIDMRVIVCRRPSRVEWKVVEHSSLPEWTGTTIRFDLSARGPRSCTVIFTHGGLGPHLECYEDCEAGWTHFLDSVVSLAVEGKGQPFGSAGGRRQQPLVDLGDSL